MALYFCNTLIVSARVHIFIKISNFQGEAICELLKDQLSMAEYIVAL